VAATTANALNVLLMWDPAVDPQYYNMQGRGTHLRSILYFNFQSPGTVSVVSWGIIALPTAAALTVPAAIVPDPSDTATWDKPWLDWGQMYLQATASQGFQSSFKRDLTQKRRLDDTEALALIVVASIANVVVRVPYRMLMKLE